MKNSINYQESMRLRRYLFHIIAILSLLLIIIGKIFSNLSYQLFLIGSILLGVFFVITGLLHLYQGVIFRKVILIGRFGASDTYLGKSAIIQGTLTFLSLSIIGLAFLTGIKKIIYLMAPFLIVMIISHFLFPPKYHSPKIDKKIWL